MYDLNKKNIEDKKLLKELSLIARFFIEKLLKKSMKISFTLIVLILETFSKESLKKSKKALNINKLIL